jgi:hypothetical protein
MLVRTPRHSWLAAAAVAVLLVGAATVRVAGVPYPFATPVFGLATAPDGSLLAADAGSGIYEIRRGVFTQVAQLPGVTDMAPIGRGDMLALTSPGFGGEGKLYRVSRGTTREIADVLAFETLVNPDGGIIESNPFDVAALTGGSALVADAAGNSLLIVDARGNIDWVATLPNEMVSTANAKQIFGCPGSGAPQCGLPDQIPAQPVATSVAIGPDGAYYVGELKGFPAPTGESRVWRIEAGARHAVCGSSASCQVVADGFTSIIDLTFGPNGTLYVVELDEASWLAMEEGQGVGGSVNACNTVTWSCNQIATGLFMVTSATVGRNGTVSVVTNALIPGAADVSALP